jgi:DNA-binding NarL/FixJ family response regulator
VGYSSYVNTYSTWSSDCGDNHTGNRITISRNSSNYPAKAKIMDETQLAEFQQEMNKLMLEFSGKATTLAREFTQKALEANKYSKFRLKRIVQTPREEEVMAGILAGLQYKEIGAKLNINPSTVKFHVTKLLKRAGVSSRRDLERMY